MNDLQKLQRVCVLFLPRLVIVHDSEAADILRLLVDEFEDLKARLAAESPRNAVDLGDCPGMLRHRWANL